MWLLVHFQPTQGQTGSSGDAHKTLLFRSCLFLSFTFPLHVRFSTFFLWCSVVWEDECLSFYFN